VINLVAKSATILFDEDAGGDEEDIEVRYIKFNLEQEFADACASVSKEIQTHLTQAGIALQKAIDIAEKHGVPFNSNISFLNNSYVPESFSSSKFASMDDGEIAEIAGIYSDYLSDILFSGGWLHSAVC